MPVAKCWYPFGWTPGFVSMSLRVFNLTKRLWCIYWLSNHDGGIDKATGALTPPVVGRSKNGMDLRLLDVEQTLWADYWVNSKSGVLTPPPAMGSFVNGIGTWDSDEKDGDQPIIVRSMWDRITPTAAAGTRPCRATTARPGWRTG